MQKKKELLWKIINMKKELEKEKKKNKKKEKKTKVEFDTKGTEKNNKGK